MITQTHQGLGGWRLALRDGGAVDDFVARLNPWDHVLITPKGLGPQPDLDSIKATSLFSGRLDTVDIDGGTVTIGGPSIAVWMGDEAGRGKYPDAVSFPGNVDPATWLGLIFTRAGVNVNGLTSSPTWWQNLQTGTITWQVKEWSKVRTKV